MSNGKIGPKGLYITGRRDNMKKGIVGIITFIMLITACGGTPKVADTNFV
jgi:hypothetical protein